MRVKAEGPRSLGVDPATGLNVYVMNGRYGAYVQLGETPNGSQKSKVKGQKVEKPKRASLQAGMTESTVTLDEALKLLSLPRVVGLHPDDNESVVTSFGRFGPYVTDGRINASIPRGSNPEAVTFEQAVELLEARRNAMPMPRRAGGRRGAPRASARGARAKAAGA
ncbi:MAG: hypothetical protein A3I61_14650 [Acidobacteria bacterium RIFCSPLOWO2_02_FULL_68_18]|nr:MAG: hypothetical protein A3I61_14650 [Acidobacteria bacterium RIFCSPLOWO2_02_FULL_68_18]OFW52210.1 MAG: hypothetical protein A3G77_08350 [Acidobacteria bacterium RIFCSPLOWO2_12_FULL_68_19]